MSETIKDGEPDRIEEMLDDVGIKSGKPREMTKEYYVALLKECGELYAQPLETAANGFYEGYIKATKEVKGFGLKVHKKVGPRIHYFNKPK